MIPRNPIAKLVLLAVGLLLPGCSDNDNPRAKIRNLQPPEAPTASDAEFEKTQDPPLSAQTHFAAAQLAESQGLAQKAAEQYRLALKLDPHHQPSMYRLGLILSQLQAHEEAIAVWQAYAKETDGNATAWSNLGFCYELAGRPNDAESAYKKGIEKDLRNVPCHINYGLMLARTGRTNEAIVQLQAVLPESQVRYNLGSVYEMLGRKDEAKAEYRKAMELDPALIDARSRLAALE